jgi:hypothetical protein
VGLRAGLDAVAKRKVPSLPVRSLVTTLTELSLLHPGRGRVTKVVWQENLPLPYFFLLDKTSVQITHILL